MRHKIILVLSISTFLCFVTNSYATDEGGDWQDPTNPASSGYVVFDHGNIELQLNEVTIRNNVYSAVINNKIMQKNDRIGKYTLIEIGRSSVVLSDGTEVLVLDLFNNAKIKSH